MFAESHWLILLLPSLFIVYLLRTTSKILNILRIIFVLLVILGLSRPIVLLPSADGTIVVVADVSSSMPSNKLAYATEIAGILKRDMPANAALGVVSFASEAKVSFAPSNKNFSGHLGEANSGTSNLADGLERALSLIPSESTGRILLLSDGRWTGRNPKDVAAKAGLRGVPIDYRVLARDFTADLAVTAFTAPSLISPHEAFLLRAEVYSPLEQDAEILLYEAGNLLTSHKRRLKMGYNDFVFNMIAGEPAVLKYRILVKPLLADMVAENNQAQAISEVVGKKPVLLISDDNGDGLESLLRASKIEFVKRGASEIAWSMEFLLSYSAVIIDDLPADRLSTHGMRVLEAWVKYFGGGLTFFGGANSFGNGGYYQSPIDVALPVSLEMRSEHRKMALAMMIILDRSGSMAAPSRGGRTKMDLANLAAAGVLDFLMNEDYLGVLAVDTEPHEVFTLAKLGASKEKLRKKMLSIESMGGGIYVYDGILKAVDSLSSIDIKTKHMILFADANDAEKPGEYWELLEKATNAGMTLSVIGLGTETDSDAGILINLAKAGKGRIFFARDPEELPRLFLQDAFVAAKSSYIEEPTQVQLLDAYKDLFPTLPINGVKGGVGAYNLTYLKQGAKLLANTLDDNNVPILSYWQYGLGKVVCLTTPFAATASDNTANFVADNKILQLISSLLEHLSYDDTNTLENASILQSIEKGYWKLSLHLDPERTRDFILGEPSVEVVRFLDNGEQKYDNLALTWETADSLTTGVQLQDNEVVSGILKIGKQVKRLAPLCQLYSSEYERREHHVGLAALKEIAALSNGAEIINLGNIWDSVPLKRQEKDLGNFFLLLGIIVFLLEVIERRLSGISLLLSWRRKRKKIAENKKQHKNLKEADSEPIIINASSSPKSQSLEPEPVPVKEEPNSLLTALKKAKDNAEKRL